MRRFRVGLLAALAFVGPLSAGAGAEDLSRYAHPEARAAIAAITRSAIASYFAQRPYRAPAARAGGASVLEGPAGAFVTLSRHGVTRACWGSVRAVEGRLADELALNAVKALRFDYRQRPIRESELEGLVAHVSITGEPEPLMSLSALRPRAFGLLLVGAGRGGAVLPGEAATAEWAELTCRRKAGLSRREPVRLYRFSTAVVGPIALSR